MSDLDFATLSEKPFRLINWIAEFEGVNERAALTLQDIFCTRCLSNNSEGLFDLLSNRIIEAAGAMDIKGLQTPTTTYVHIDTADRVRALIGQYQEFGGQSSALTMADLFAGKNLDPSDPITYDEKLDSLLDQLPRLGIYWPSNHFKANHGKTIANVLRDASFWGKLLFEETNDGPDVHLGDATFRDLFTRSGITQEGQQAMRFLIEEGVVRPYINRPVLNW